MMQDFPQLDPPRLPLRAVMRSAPPLAPEDSLGRFLLLLRQLGVTELPVIEDGKVAGMASQNAAFTALRAETDAEREAILQQPVALFLTPPAAVAHPQMSPQEAGLLCSQFQTGILPVVDANGYCLGIVLAADLLVPTLPLPKPSPIGGMATPFGVYLTDGTNQAGASNLALVTTGAFMGILFYAVTLIIINGVNFGLRHKWLPASVFGDNPASPLTGTLVSIVLSGIGFLGFLLLMRATRLAGYHAAEHQTVHAIERNEPLISSVVARMPRPHPRCGTNLMAAGLLFTVTFKLCSAIPDLSDFSEIIAFLVAATQWRRVGTFLQARFTTRPARERELQSGILAGTILLDKYYNSPPGRTRPLRRLWCMGMVQVFCGMMLSLAFFQALEWIWERFVSR